MKSLIVVLSIFVLTSCGKKEPQLFSGGGGVGVGSGAQYTTYLSNFGFALSANSNLTFNEDEFALHLDNSFYTKEEGARTSRLKAQKMVDTWFNGKEVNWENLKAYLAEKESDKEFSAREFSHYNGLCNEKALAKRNLVICYVPISKASLLVRFQLELWENSPESYLLSQAMGSVKERD